MVLSRAGGRIYSPQIIVLIEAVAQGKIACNARLELPLAAMLVR